VEAVAAELDRLAAARTRMPMTRVEREYLFAGPQGDVSLADVFAGRRQLILYRFFFEEGVSGWPDAGCVGCSSSWAEGVADLNLLHARDITFGKVLPRPQPRLKAYDEDGLDRPALVHDQIRLLHGGLRSHRLGRSQRVSARGG
jgi:predicted dithiol-disulfide oxidoreductase (DUF899 family)